MTVVYVRPFQPKGATVNQAVDTSSAATAITRSGIGTQSIRLLNSGSNTVFVNFGSSTITASTTTSMPLLANSVETFTIEREVTHFAAISAATGNTLYGTTGESA